MTKGWAKRLTRWGPHTEADVTYSLNHLHPFRFPVELPASEKYAALTVDMRVGFSCHTFTRERRPEDVTAPYLAREYEVRMFCSERYRLSHLLPDIVRALPGRNCFYANRENYFIVEAHDLLAAHQEYRVFFDVRYVGASDAVLLYVQSAYAADREKGRPHGITRKKVGFRVLISHALRNTKPKPPP